MTQHKESPFFRKRRARRERLLSKVGAGSDMGQRLLDKWWREDQATVWRNVSRQEPQEATA